MTTKGFLRAFKPLELLTEDQVEVIHQGCLDILENTGIKVENERALKIFDGNDCKVNYEDRRVRIPPGLVEECLRKAPSGFHVKARDPKNDIRMGGNTVYFLTLAGFRILDLETWETRVATQKEVRDGITVLDALDNLHILGLGLPYTDVEGISASMQESERTAAKLRGSTKVQNTAYMLDCDIFNVAMAKAVGAEIMVYFSAEPPLAFASDHTECLFRVVEAGFPVVIGGLGLMGSQSPATFAGSLQSGIAPQMAAIVLTQLIRPGTRVAVTHFGFAQNMRSGVPAFGGIETALFGASFAQIWRRHRIPTVIGGTAASSSKRIDFQCGYEKGIGVLLCALSGFNVIALYGGIYGELAFHPVQAILDDDIGGMIGRFLEGILVNDETLATELIQEVGPVPGMYLDKEHTRRWWKREQFLPKVADRLSYPEWVTQGKKSALDYAKARMEEILATHHPKALTPKQDEEIERILGEARKYYLSK